METLYDRVKENALERDALTKRQDNDVLLRNLSSYIMYETDGKTKVEGVVYRTLNRPKVIYNYIIASLNRATEQIVVETEETNLDTDYIKDFRRLSFAASDARLRKQGESVLNPYFVEQSCLRGGISALCLYQEIEGKLKPEITKWDYRYTNYEKGEEGLSWASFGYGTKRKKADIENSKWWVKRMKGVQLPDKIAQVLSIWDTEHNEIWLDEQKVFEQENIFRWPDGTRYVPVVIEPVSLGSMIADEGDIKNQSESVFFLIREAVPELNRMASIILTIAVGQLKPPGKIKTVEGTTIPGDAMPGYNETFAPGSLTNANPEIINLGDANNAVLMAAEIASKSMDEGGFTLDIFSAPLASGIAIIQAKEGKDVIYLPRLENIALAKQGIGDMITAQVLQIGGSVEVGTLGHKRLFDTGKLKGQYDVTHKFSVRSLTEKAGLASLAASLGTRISEHTKMREIDQLDDPDGEERLKSYEAAGREIPLIRYAISGSDSQRSTSVKAAA